jgi:hypothetical protein
VTVSGVGWRAHSASSASGFGEAGDGFGCGLEERNASHVSMARVKRVTVSGVGWRDDRRIGG